MRRNGAPAGKDSPAVASADDCIATNPITAAGANRDAPDVYGGDGCLVLYRSHTARTHRVARCALRFGVAGLRSEGIGHRTLLPAIWICRPRPLPFGSERSRGQAPQTARPVRLVCDRPPDSPPDGADQPERNDRRATTKPDVARRTLNADGEERRRAVCGRTACTDRGGGGRKPSQSGQHMPRGSGVSRRPYLLVALGRSLLFLGPPGRLGRG
jgi:hypothetical protein